jgi:hypothetical protein
MGLLLIDTISKNKAIFNPSPDLDSNKYGIWDLTRPSITYDGVNVKISEVFIVGEDYQMRPDLIAAIKLGDHSKMGSLLKLNNISNPFAIDSTRILMLPTSSTIDNTFNVKKSKNQAAASSNTSTNANQVFRNNQEQKKFKVSDGRKKFLASKIKNSPEMSLPPNIMQPSQRTVIKQDGFLIFAPDSGGGGLNKPSN